MNLPRNTVKPKKMEKKDFSNCHCTPINSIRVFCIQCMGYKPHHVAECDVRLCPLFAYRMKKRPSNSKLVSVNEGIEISKRNS